MNRPLGILLLGALAGVTAFFCASRLGSSTHNSSPPHSEPDPHAHHQSQRPSDTPPPELAWLAAEFRLTPQAFEQIQALHHQYQPRCGELCQRIEEHNRRLESTILDARDVTPDILKLVEQGARVRAECHAALTRHLLEVASCMTPNQGRRYLELMLPATGITAASHPISDFTHARPDE